MARKKGKRGCWGCLGLFVLALVAGGYFGATYALRPTPAGPNRYLRFAAGAPLSSALDRLEKEKIVRHSWAVNLFARFRRNDGPVKAGTYLLHPGMEAEEVLAALRKPVRQMVRLPETNWAARNANLLEKAGVCTAQEYLELVRQPAEFKDAVDFALPEKGSLEGYLYPDTYDLPPLLGAKGVIQRQLENFKRKMLEDGGPPPNLRKALIVASLVELEVARDEERPIVAGVIENRLSKGMPLQIDASLLYGIQKWRTLTFADYRNIDSPYNLYRHKGLPPGPICSPTVKSLRAALNPAKHNYLYYVALPSGQSLFSATYDGHLRNIAKRKAALLALQKARAE